MYRLIAVMTNLVLLAALSPNRPNALTWDAKTIVWQKVDSDGTKWSVLEGRSDVAGEAFTYAAFVPADSMTFTAFY